MKIIKLMLLIFVLFFISCSDSNNNEGNDDNNKTIFDDEKKFYSIIERCDGEGKFSLAKMNELILRYQGLGFLDVMYDYSYKKYELIDSSLGNELFLEAYKKVYSCIVNAKTCEEFYKCQGISKTTENCNGEAYACEGKILHSCKNGILFKQDCSVIGAKCGSLSCELENKEVQCKERSRCNGENELVLCNSVRGEVAFNCDEFIPGTSCKETKYSHKYSHFCTGSDSCDDNFKSSCNGDVAKFCNKSTFYKIIEVDCKKTFGEFTTCDENQYVTGTLASPCVVDFNLIFSDKCAAGEKDYCDGDILTYCSKGMKGTFDCKENGYTSCKTESNETFCYIEEEEE